MKRPLSDEDDEQCGGMTAPTAKNSLCTVACSAATNDLRQALYAVVSADLCLLLLPLALLAAAAPSDEGCGWTPQALDVHCAVALALLWLSLIITAAQLVAISAAGPLRRALFVDRLWWHLPASLVGTVVGGALGVQALIGYLALVRGDCGDWSKGVLWASFVISCLVMAVYVYISRVEAKAVEGLNYKDADSRLSLLNGDPEHPKGVELSEDQQVDQTSALVSVVPTLDGKNTKEEVEVDSLRAMEHAAKESVAQGDVDPDRQIAAPSSPLGAGSTGIPSHGSEGHNFRNTAAADAAAGGSASDDIGHSGAGPADAGAAGAADAGAGRNSRKHSKEKRISVISVNSLGRTNITAADRRHSTASCTSITRIRPLAKQMVVQMPGARPLPSPVSEVGDFFQVQPMVSSWGSARSGPGNNTQRRRSAQDGHIENRRRQSAESKKTFKRASWCATTGPSGGDYAVVQSLMVPPASPVSDRPKIIPPANTMMLTPNAEENEEDNKSSSIERCMEGAFKTRRASLMGFDGPSESSGSASPGSASPGGSPKKGRTRQSQLQFQEPDITEFPVSQEMRRCSRRPGSPTFDEVVFNSGQNPINFSNLMERDDSDMEDESGSDIGDIDEEGSFEPRNTEVWKNKSQPKVEVPFWLMERLQSRGPAPQEEGEEVESSSPKSADGREGGKKLQSKTRPSTPDEKSSKSHPSSPDEPAASAAEGARKNGLKEMAKKGSDQGKQNAHPVIMPSNTFWKIPMPTRKNTMMIQVPSGGMKQKPNQLGEETVLEEDEEDDEVMSSDSQASKGHPLDSGECSDLEDESPEQSPSNSTSNREASQAEITDADNRRVSFCDQELGIALPKYSEEREKHKPNKPGLGAITEDEEAEAFEDDDPFPGLARRMSSVNKRTAKGASRRPSVLGIFSDESAKQEGLYLLPNHQENSSEVVEVRRSSVVMSTSMLTDILLQKVGPSGDIETLQRLDDISEDTEEFGSQQVVLPFFSPQQKAGRSQCQCKTDPMTGFVIHTCMTPSTTQATNTGAMASYLCSEWGSRRHSTAVSRSSKSRRNSGDLVDGEEDDRPTELIPPPPKAHPNNRKRIRNASMLAVVGGQGPTAAKKVEVEEEIVKDNELAISVKNIQDISSNQGTQDGIPDGQVNFKESGGTNDMDELASKEQRVEADLGHRFELVEPYALASMLKDPEVREQLLTVDVRGRDWVGGHIPSSINLRTSEVVENPFQLLVQCRRNRVHHIIFTCMYSVLRARKCAVAVEKAQEQEKQGGNSPYRLRISLLAGGMHAWINHFMKTQHDTPPKCFIDSFEPDMWSDGGPSQGGLVHVMDALWSSGGQKALSDALSQELEQLLKVRRSSQQSSRRESVASNTSVPAEPRQRRGSEQDNSETPITPEMAAEQLMLARPRRGSGAEGHGQSVGQLMGAGVLPGLVLGRGSKRDSNSDSNPDSDMT